MHNQTKSDWKKLNEHGTGIFLLPDVHSDSPRATHTEYVNDLTYEECVQRGELALAFKWVPHSIASLSDLKSCCTDNSCP